MNWFAIDDSDDALETVDNDGVGVADGCCCCKCAGGGVAVGVGSGGSPAMLNESETAVEALAGAAVEADGTRSAGCAAPKESASENGVDAADRKGLDAAAAFLLILVRLRQN